MCRSYPTSMSSMTRWKRLLTRRQNSQVHPSTLSVRTLSQSCATQWWISTSGSKGRWDTSTIFIYCFCSIVFCLLWCWWDDVSCQDVTDHDGDEDGGEGRSSQQEVSKTFRALLSPAEYWILKSHDFPVFFFTCFRIAQKFFTDWLTTSFVSLVLQKSWPSGLHQIQSIRPGVRGVCSCFVFYFCSTHIDKLFGIWFPPFESENRCRFVSVRPQSHGDIVR